MLNQRKSPILNKNILIKETATSDLKVEICEKTLDFLYILWKKYKIREN